MPTEYTVPLYEGKGMTFEQFALRCARNFGALVDMREEPLDAPIPEEFQVDDFYQKEYEKAKADYENFKQHPPTDEELEEAYVKYVQRETDHANKANEEAALMRQRYEAMLEKARRWIPPTPEHVNLRNFIIDQLKQSMDFDCNEYHPRISEKQKWMEYERSGKAYKDGLQFSKANLDRATKTCAARNVWIKDLRDSLRSFEKGEQA